MGIVKISDHMHDQVRSASQVMERSINAQAEFWLKIGRLAELNPTQSFSDIIQQAFAEQRQGAAPQNHE